MRHPAELRGLLDHIEAIERAKWERSQVERKDMIRHLTMDMKLRDEDEIANERREGSSMSKGGKDDFVHPLAPLPVQHKTHGAPRHRRAGHARRRAALAC